MQKANTNYLKYLDGLRGYAIIIVILSHIGLGKIIPGGVGVTLFFFISGFLITKLLIGEFSETGKINLKKFYSRRLIRLYPALIFMIISTIIVLYIIKATIYWKDIMAALLYLTNYYGLYFKQSNVNDVNSFGILWSLSIEEHFYLIFPIAFYWLYSANFFLLRFLIFLSFLTLFLRCYLLYTSSNIEYTSNEIYISTHTRIDSIIGGCIAALLIFKYNNEKYLKLLKSSLSIYLAMVLMLFSLLFRNVLFRDSLRYSIHTLVFLLFVPSIGFKTNSKFVKIIFENKFIVLVGKLSYSLYLFHWVSITLVSKYLKEFSFNWLFFTVFFTVFLSLISYYLIEKSFISLRKKLGSHVS